MTKGLTTSFLLPAVAPIASVSGGLVDGSFWLGSLGDGSLGDGSRGDGSRGDALFHQENTAPLEVLAQQQSYFKWTLESAGIAIQVDKPVVEGEPSSPSRVWRSRFAYAEGYVQAPKLNQVTTLEKDIYERRADSDQEQADASIDTPKNSVVSGSRLLALLYINTLDIPVVDPQIQAVREQFLGNARWGTLRFFAAALQWQRNQFGELVLLCAGVVTFRGIGKRADLLLRPGSQGYLGELTLDRRDFLHPEERNERSRSVVFHLADGEVNPILRVFLLFSPRKSNV